MNLSKVVYAIAVLSVANFASSQEPQDLQSCIREHQQLLVGEWSRTGHGGFGTFAATVTRMPAEGKVFIRTESFQDRTVRISEKAAGPAVVVEGHSAGPGGLVMAIELCQRSPLNNQILEVRSFRGVYEGMANEYRGVVTSTSDQSISFLSARPAGTDGPFTPVYSHFDVRKQ